MNDSEHDQIEKYERIVNSLFSLLLERLYHSQNELIRLKVEHERELRDKQMQAMMKATE